MQLYIMPRYLFICLFHNGLLSSYIISGTSSWKYKFEYDRVPALSLQTAQDTVSWREFTKLTWRAGSFSKIAYIQSFFVILSLCR